MRFYSDDASNISIKASTDESPRPTPSCAEAELKKLSFGHNNAEQLCAVLVAQKTVCLDYLNLRRAKISADAVASIAPLLGKQGSIKTLVLDGIKLAGTGAFNNLFGSWFVVKLLLVFL